MQQLKKLIRALTLDAKRFRRALVTHGISFLIRGLWYRVAFPRLAPLIAPLAVPALDRHLYSGKDRRWLVFIATLDWKFPYWHRGHHLVSAFLRLGWSVIYVTPGAGYDCTTIASRADNNLVITPHRVAAIVAAGCPLVYCSSTDALIDDAIVDLIRSRGGKIIYDYVDAFDDQISSGPLSNARQRIHRQLLSDQAGTICIATAQSLLAEISSSRNGNFALVSNGVDFEHFSVERARSQLRPDFELIVARGRPIIGYFGALANWVDYSLISLLSAQRPNYEILLVGIDFDGSVAQLRGHASNLHILSPIPYSELPRHAAWFDVGLIPFVVNEITRATSPLKLFEYLALGLPIVSTDIPECLRYQSVAIANEPDKFISLIDEAIMHHNDSKYVEALVQEARTHDWSLKARKILKVVDSDPMFRECGYVGCSRSVPL